MKKFFSGILALSLAIGAVAFTEVKQSSDENLFWYKRNADGTYANDHTPNTATSAPSTSCSGSGQYCVKGFTASQTPSLITDATAAQDEKSKNP
ncbi:MAG: hypothetical protein QM763_09460 [Agriterribacter sp.]